MVVGLQMISILESVFGWLTLPLRIQDVRSSDPFSGLGCFAGAFYYFPLSGRWQDSTLSVPLPLPSKSFSIQCPLFDTTHFAAEKPSDYKIHSVSTLKLSHWMVDCWACASQYKFTGFPFTVNIKLMFLWELWTVVKQEHYFLFVDSGVHNS
jgi:hypothetical protein